MVRYIDAYFNTMNHLVHSVGKAAKAELEANGCTEKYLKLLAKQSHYAHERDWL